MTKAGSPPVYVDEMGRTIEVRKDKVIVSSGDLRVTYKKDDIVKLLNKGALPIGEKALSSVLKDLGIDPSAIPTLKGGGERTSGERTTGGKKSTTGEMDLAISDFEALQAVLEDMDKQFHQAVYGGWQNLGPLKGPVEWVTDILGSVAPNLEFEGGKFKGISFGYNTDVDVYKKWKELSTDLKATIANIRAELYKAKEGRGDPERLKDLMEEYSEKVNKLIDLLLKEGYKLDKSIAKYVEGALVLIFGIPIMRMGGVVLKRVTGAGIKLAYGLSKGAFSLSWQSLKALLKSTTHRTLLMALLGSGIGAYAGYRHGERGLDLLTWGVGGAAIGGMLGLLGPHVIGLTSPKTTFRRELVKLIARFRKAKGRVLDAIKGLDIKGSFKAVKDALVGLFSNAKGKLNPKAYLGAITATGTFFFLSMIGIGVSKNTIKALENRGAILEKRLREIGVLAKGEKLTWAKMKEILENNENTIRALLTTAGYTEGEVEELFSSAYEAIDALASGKVKDVAEVAEGLASAGLLLTTALALEDVSNRSPEEMERIVQAFQELTSTPTGAVGAAGGS